MRTLFKDFVTKFVLVCGFAFLLALFILFFYFKKEFFEGELKKLSNCSAKIVDEIREEGNRFLSIAENKSFDEIEKHIILGKKTNKADFITLVDSNGTIIKRSSNITGDSIENEPFFKFVLTLKKGEGFFHFLRKPFLERELITEIGNLEKALVYSVFIPIKEKNKTFFIWYCNVLNRKTDIFDIIKFFGIDGAMIWDGTNIYVMMNNDLTNNIFDKNIVVKKEVLKDIYPIITIRLANHKYIGNELQILDFNQTYLASLFVFNKEEKLFSLLYSYTASIVIIFLFASSVGIIFVAFYFKKISGFIKELEYLLEKVKKTESFDYVIKNRNILEFKHIIDSIKNMADIISNNINMLEEKVQALVDEFVALTKTLRDLDDKQNFVELVDCAIDLIKEYFKCNVIPIEEYNKLSEIEKERFLKVSYFYDEKEYGFCVDKEIVNKTPYSHDFFELFKEIYKTNFERIANFRSVQRSYNEASYLSEIILSLLKKGNTNEILMYILEKAKEFCKSDAAYIGIYDKKEHHIRLQFFKGVYSDEFKTLSFSANYGLGGYIIKHGKPVFIENYYEDERIISPFKDIIKKEGLISVIATPIIFEDEIYGIIYVAYRKLKKSISNEMQFLEKLAYVAALSLEREKLLAQSLIKEEELRKAYEEILSKRQEINVLLKNYKDTNAELEKINREVSEQYNIVRKSYDELEKLNRAKDIFLGILSHELKTPISILKGYMDTLLSNKFSYNEDLKEILLECKKSVSNLWQIVDDLLDYSRIQLGKMEISRNKIAFVDIINALKEEISTYLRERKQTLELNIEDGLFINADVRWIKRALTSLLLNSIKFTPDGKKISIIAKTLSKDELSYPTYCHNRPLESSKYVMISVKDEGIGINISDINRIFEKFYELGDIKGHSTGKYKFLSKGLGMGLSFVKEIVSLHGGVVFAESPGFNEQLCPGSTFTIYMPLEPIKNKDMEKNKKLILIIESEHEISSFLEMLFSTKYNVKCISDGGLGYIKTLELNPMLVMVNVSLSGYSGYEICSMIKQDKKTENVPVILYSTGMEAFDETMAERARANMLFSPLFDVDNLLRIVNFYAHKDIG